jgi:hypothetical protein
MQVSLRDISAERAAALATQIDVDGFAVVDGYVDPDALKSAQDFVRARVAANGGNYLDFKGVDQLGGTFLQALPLDPAFVGLCHTIYEKSTGEEAPDVPFYQVLRCLSGELAQANSLKFHFDSYVLTALIPIIIPEEGKLGDLLIIPNVRKIRSAYIYNLIDKVFLDNPFSQKLLKRLYLSKSKRIRHISLIPGNLYLFYGYRSIHTNEECSPDKIRSTALLHYVDPHADSRIKSLLGRS